MLEIEIRPVGFVRNELKERPFTPVEGGDADEARWKERVRQMRQDRESVSELVINEDIQELLDGVEEFSHLLVLFWADRVSKSQRAMRKVHPMGRKDFPQVGIFATRSPVRPNPILATTVRLLERRANILKVTELEALDGTPILDIKPQMREDVNYDKLKVPDWMDRIHREFAAEESNG